MSKVIVVAALLLLLMGCSESDNGGTVGGTVNETSKVNDSIWILENSHFLGRFSSYLEFKEGVATESWEIRTGELCRETSSVVDWQVVNGDINVDDTLNINYTDHTGQTINVNIYRTPNDEFKYSPLCTDTNTINYWNGIYVEKNPSLGIDNYWVIEIPTTTRYGWDEVNSCYSASNIEEWLINSSFLSAYIREYTVFFGPYMATFGTARGTQLGIDKITVANIAPLC